MPKVESSWHIDIRDLGSGFSKLQEVANGFGYAIEGARTALAYAFTALGEDRVISLIHPENRASIRVAERIGERLQGRINHLGREMLCYVARRTAVPR